MSLTKVGGVLSASLNGLNYPVKTVEYLVVAGGGGGGQQGGGAGAGGVSTATGYAITLGSAITVTVGAGGIGSPRGGTYYATNGANSVFGSITATGGGAGGANSSGSPGNAGGSGGGGGYGGTSGGAGTSGQGNVGGTGNATSYVGGGGGGAGSAGLDSSLIIGVPTGNGGAGIVSSITGSPIQYACGGGAGGWQAAGIGGGVSAGNGNFGDSQPAITAVANTGSGGGGGGNGGTYGASGAGGSGIVVIRYPAYQVQATSTTGSPTTYIAGPYRVYVFYASGTITF